MPSDISSIHCRCVCKVRTEWLLWFDRSNVSALRRIRTFRRGDHPWQQCEFGYEALHFSYHIHVQSYVGWYEGASTARAVAFRSPRYPRTRFRTKAEIHVAFYQGAPCFRRDLALDVQYSTEWQKRAHIWHAHSLVWLFEKIIPDKINEVISAEIPDTGV